MKKVRFARQPVPTAISQELEEKIQQRAYQIFEARGRQEGFDLEDWLRAEAEITAQKSRSAAA